MEFFLILKEPKIHFTEKKRLEKRTIINLLLAKKGTEKTVYHGTLSLAKKGTEKTVYLFCFIFRLKEFFLFFSIDKKCFHYCPY